MPKSRPPYPPEFRWSIVAVAGKGRTPEELARQFELSAQAIRNWLKEAALDAGLRPRQLDTEVHHSGDGSAWPRKALHQPTLDGVIAVTGKDDWDAGGGGLSRGKRISTARKENVRALLDQIARCG